MTASTAPDWPAGALAPAAGAAPLGRMLAAQTATELRLTLRRGESVLLTLVIPVVLLVLFAAVPLVDLGPGRRVDFLVPGLLSLAVMSTAFTGQAIATGYERHYGVLKRLGATALPRWALLVAKTAAVLAVEVLQVVVLAVVGLALGWRPHGSVVGALLLVVLGTAAFSGLGLLMAGLLRAEVTLAAANLVYVLLLVVGGVVFPLTKFPPGVRSALVLLPVTALSDGLRAVLRAGEGMPLHALVVLVVWAVGSLTLAALTFRWE
ncbi:MAG: ABC transporter permease [Actinomycetota bacterium]|nr:ABC transporter permease [Actinomycetota bacterium]